MPYQFLPVSLLPVALPVGARYTYRVLRGHFIKDWMSVNIICLSPMATVLEALFLMRQHRIRCLPVTTGTRLLGIITEGNLRNPIKTLQELESEKMYKTEGDIRVRDIMSTKLLTITPQDHIVTAAHILAKHKIGGLPVIEKKGSEHIIGVVTTTDLLRAFVELADVTNY